MKPSTASDCRVDSMSINGEKTPLAPTEKKPANRHEGQGCFIRHITMICRFTGIAVLAVLWTATVMTVQGHVDTPPYVGYYLITATTIISFFEITWILDKMACCIRAGCCCQIWSVILWVDGWPKFVLYTALSVPLFIQGIKGIIDIVSGFCLLLLAILYLVKSFTRIKRAQTSPGGPEPIPGDTKPTLPVVKHETFTQSDVTSVNMEQSTVGTQTSQHPRNPFDDAEGVDLDVMVDASTSAASPQSAETADDGGQVLEAALKTDQTD